MIKPSMSGLERLEQDHQIIRTHLKGLEAALRRGQWGALRSVCVALLKQLGSHIRREHQVAEACSAPIEPPASLTHHDETQQLRVLQSVLFVRGVSGSVQEVRPALETLIRNMREHLAAQETTVFPTLPQVASRAQGRLFAAAPALGTSEHSGINETMTVDDVLDAYPETRWIFESLFVNLAYERYDYLDEVASRRGIDPRQLVARLQQASRLRTIPSGEALIN